MSAELIKENLRLFSCPICHRAMEQVNKSLVCKGNHCFDIAKNGYINFLNSPVSNDYDKEMLSSRKLVMDSGFFNPLLDRIIELAKPYSGYLLDAGCGEGTHLNYIINGLNKAFIGVGIDISKSGILLAAGSSKKSVWTVGDLAKTPFSCRAFDIIVNILSPSNYQEFSRMLKNQGLLIKAVPSSGYLKELRQIFYENSDKSTYSNEKVLSLFSENFPKYTQEKVQYKFDTPPQLLEHIIKMSPLSWKVTPEKLEQALNSNIKEITMDFTLLKGVKTSD